MFKSQWLLVPILLFPMVASAHDASAGGGFYVGLTHPVLGFDHLLAMLSVGLLSMQMGGKSLWSIPTTFVCVMLLGGVMGMSSIPLFSVETGIALSVLALGIAVTCEQKMAPMMAMIFVAAFAIFHGYAHGAEMPKIAEPINYALGFVVGTSLIHITGLLVGYAMRYVSGGGQFLRYLGAGIAGIGFHLLIA